VRSVTYLGTYSREVVGVLDENLELSLYEGAGARSPWPYLRDVHWHMPSFLRFNSGSDRPRDLDLG
jgi:hypothetical protein